jgi:hypothetical protein
MIDWRTKKWRFSNEAACGLPVLRVECPACQRWIGVLSSKHLLTHGRRGDRCSGSGTSVYPLLG